MVYRMAVSDRQDPDGFHVNEKGEMDPDGKLRLDYIGVCEVEAWIPMDGVRLDVQDSKLVVAVPAIQLYPVVNYEMSFVWKESSRIPNGAVPKVMEAIRGRAVEQATERGILDDAKVSAQRWFDAFLKPFGQEVAVQFDG